MGMPRVEAKKIITVLGKLGFKFSRQPGSHAIYKNAEGKRVTVPMHAGKTLHPKTLKSIATEAGITIEELKKLL